jgi:uncharacterized membrane protein (DUF485 family)
MKQGSRSKTSPKVARELWERLNEKPTRDDPAYLSWHYKHHIEPWLLTIIIVACYIGLAIMGLSFAISIIIPTYIGNTSRDIFITTQRIVISVFLGIGIFVLPGSIRSYYKDKPRTKLNTILSYTAQGILLIVCLLGWLVLTEIVHLENRLQTIITLALFLVLASIYIIKVITEKKVSQQNIGFALLVITASITSILALIHLW